MSIIYKTCPQDGIIPDYMCDPCGATEKGRVRGVAYIHKSLKSTITKQNVESLSWWENGIESGMIKIIPSTRGTFDGGAKVTVTGFGDEHELVTGKTFTVVFNDRNHTENEEFYEILENNFKNYILAFRTESELRIGTDALNSMEAKDNVEEDDASIVLWQATATWNQNKPKLIVPIYQLTDDVKDLFANCVDEISQ